VAPPRAPRRRPWPCKTLDGGETWTHLGLEETHHISQVRIHPDDPNTVFVAAYRHAFGPNPERGVYRTKDGGETWEQVLFKSETAGIIDLVINEANPTVDGTSQTQGFLLSMNPNEPYTQEQADERFEFWMAVYEDVEATTQRAIAALALRDDVLARLEEFKACGADAASLRVAEESAAAVTKLAEGYEAIFVSTGRTLAEIINLPAKIFTKLAWLNNMMEVTEGPVTTPMKEAYARTITERDAANQLYDEAMPKAVKAFEAAIGQ